MRLKNGGKNYKLLVMKDIGTKIFPLKCETKQICVSLSSGGSCEDVFGKADKNNLVLRHTVPGSTAHREEVLKFLTEEMVNIHKMAGQGKGNFMPRSTFSENYCTIFDWFALDDDLKGKVGFITKNYSPYGKNVRQYISVENAKKVDVIRETIESWKKSKKISLSCVRLGLNHASSIYEGFFITTKKKCMMR